MSGKGSSSSVRGFNRQAWYAYVAADQVVLALHVRVQPSKYAEHENLYLPAATSAAVASSHPFFSGAGAKRATLLHVGSGSKV
ncbi:hypothetical protein E2562_014201 [Oryza meyeriana var. granulata]|uniref:Uncharacterized protein n=1 Tax=Oryza meyeriana var. granulata TaxID=110450 RepID=A0A6G1BK93_9ORYZ|nr:hypothetical protein E2562_014201 [Oryza meyeriana var. granulata]